jgi:hypothetical protein
LERDFLRADGPDRCDWIGGKGFPSIKAHRSPAGAKGGRSSNAIGRWRGRQTIKIHAITDDHSRPTALLITLGNTPDLVGARTLLAMVPSLRRLLADRAYDAQSLCAMS